MNNLPSGWVLATLGQLAGGGQYGWTTKAAEQGTTKFLRTTDITHPPLDWNRVPYCADVPADVEKYTLQSGDILISRAGSVGFSTLLDNVPSPTVFASYLIRFLPNPSIVVSQYLAQFLRSPEYWRQVAGASSGIALANVNATKLAQVEVPLAPLAEQKRAADKLKALQKLSRGLRETLDEVPAVLDRLRQSILAAAFRGDLTADWRARNPNVEPADELLEKIRAERRRRWEAAEFAKLTAKGKPPTDDRWKDRYNLPCYPLGSPKSNSFGPGPSTKWAEAPLDALCDATRGITYGVVLTGEPTPGGVPTVRCGDIKNFEIQTGNLKLVAPEVAAQFGRTRLDGGEVVIAIRGTVGATAVTSPEMQGMNVSREVAVLPVLDGLQADFLMYLLASPAATAILSHQTKGIAQSGVNIADLRNFPIPVPPFAEQIVLAGEIRRRLMSIAKIGKLVHAMEGRLSQLDEAVLAKAFRGELVPQDPNDEPASVLLERLRAEAAAAPAKPGRRTRTPAVSDSSFALFNELSGSESPAPPIVAGAAQAVPAPAPAEPMPLAKPARPAALPTTLVQQPPLPGIAAIDFLDLPAGTQSEQVHDLLLGEGALEREDAVRRAADLLRDTGRASHQRLRRDGPLATCIDAAIAVGLRQGSFDRPEPGVVRALAPSPDAVPPALLRRALLAALAEPGTDADAAVRDAAAWSQAQFGLEFQRLRAGGRIDAALRAVLAEMLASREIVSDRHGILSPGPRRG